MPTAAAPPATPSTADAPTPTTTRQTAPSASATASPVARATAAAIDVIVDNRDPGFSTHGNWFTGDGGHSYNEDCAWAPRGIGNVASFNPRLPMPGSYEVYAWWCGDPNHDQANRASINIMPTLGFVAPNAVTIDPQQDAGRWNSLGVYYLDTAANLTIASDQYGNVVADAVRFVFRSSERLSVTPTPLPTIQAWTNHPPSPLAQVTAGDLSLRLGLTDRWFSDARMEKTEAVLLDDCRDLPREGCGGARGGWRVTVKYQDVEVGYRVSDDYRWVALSAPPALAKRQLVFLSGLLGDIGIWVYRYPDGEWYVCAARPSGGGMQGPLQSEQVALLEEMAARYGTVRFNLPDGTQMRLLGLGEMAALSAADERRMRDFGIELTVHPWQLLAP